jgi:hypothetical protein
LILYIQKSYQDDFWKVWQGDNARNMRREVSKTILEEKLSSDELLVGLKSLLEKYDPGDEVEELEVEVESTATQ